MGGKGDQEGGPSTRRAACRDPPVVPLDDLAAYGQPHPRPLVVTAAMQTLEHPEDSIQIDLLEPDPVILDGDLIPGLRRVGR